MGAELHRGVNSTRAAVGWQVRLLGQAGKRFGLVEAFALEREGYRSGWPRV